MKKRVKITIPKQLTQLCRLLGVTPEEVLQTFIYNISMDAQSSGMEHRRHAQEYFISMGYGRDQYTLRQVESMFDDLLSLMSELVKLPNSEGKQMKRDYLARWSTKWGMQRNES